jgi:GNAT superfamily N-acetyltransferase
VSEFVPGYSLIIGSGNGRDRSRLLIFMQNTYIELFPEGNFPYLESAIARFFSSETPLLWVRPLETSDPIAGLWLGSATEQGTGEQQAHILLLYVMPEHRRRGIGAALVRYAETWAKTRGDRQIGLQVFETNLPAMTLYQTLGYSTQSHWMTKSLD